MTQRQGRRLEERQTDRGITGGGNGSMLAEGQERTGLHVKGQEGEGWDPVLRPI